MTLIIIKILMKQMLKKQKTHNKLKLGKKTEKSCWYKDHNLKVIYEDSTVLRTSSCYYFTTP